MTWTNPHPRECQEDRAQKQTLKQIVWFSEATIWPCFTGRRSGYETLHKNCRVLHNLQDFSIGRVSLLASYGSSHQRKDHYNHQITTPATIRSKSMTLTTSLLKRPARRISLCRHFLYLIHYMLKVFKCPVCVSMLMDSYLFFQESFIIFVLYLSHFDVWFWEMLLILNHFLPFL